MRGKVQNQDESYNVISTHQADGCIRWQELRDSFQKSKYPFVDYKSANTTV